MEPPAAQRLSAMAESHTTRKRKASPTPHHGHGGLRASSRRKGYEHSTTPPPRCVADITGHVAANEPAREFQALEEESARATDGGRLCCAVGRDVENEARNRYHDVLPYDETRVVLSKARQGSASDYINASWISDGAFIATQAPLEGTIGDFWHMVWETKSLLVVMLESSSGRALKYWPSEENVPMSYGDLSVVLLRTCHLVGGAITQRTIAIRFAQEQQREVYHYQYVEWPDYGVPATTHAMRQFIDTLFSLHGRAPEEADPNTLPWPPSARRILPRPIVVHCSAGVGRTGTFIAVMTVVQRMLAQVAAGQNIDFDVFGTVQRMRRERPRMVQRVEQYMFVYAVVVQEARELGAIPGEPEHRVHCKSSHQEAPSAPASR